MGSDEEMIEQIEGMRQRMESLRHQMNDAERQMTEQDHTRNLAKMDEMLAEARVRIRRRDALRKEASAYTEAHKNNRPPA